MLSIRLKIIVGTESTWCEESQGWSLAR